MDDYVWVGCNRAAGERKGGGVGMLIRRGGNWQRENQGCKEHLWVCGTVGGKKTRLGVAYLWTGNDAREQNKELVDCLRKDIKKFKESGEVILVGDLNAHIEDLDGYTDYSGSMVLDMCEEQQLVIVNREHKCDGQITWQSGNRQSCIDYGLVSEHTYERLNQMMRDEEGENSLGSDHRRIILKFDSGGARQETPEVGLPKLSEKQVADIVNSIERELEAEPTKVWEYDEVVSCIQKEIYKVRKQNRWRGKRKPRSWWDKEIKLAIEERQRASRLHRKAKQMGYQDEEVQLRWSRYREKKFEVQKLVQAKIKTASEKWVSGIRKKDKSAPQKFWNHLKALGTTTKEVQTQIQDGDGNVLLGDSALVMANTFGQTREISATRTHVANRRRQKKNSISNFWIGKRQNTVFPKVRQQDRMVSQ